MESFLEWQIFLTVHGFYDSRMLKHIQKEKKVKRGLKEKEEKERNQIKNQTRADNIIFISNNFC